MQKLSVDPLAEIGKKFKNPLDIVAFELSSKNAKYAVEKYNLYREWEKRQMPNDDLRIIATHLVTTNAVMNLNFQFNEVPVIIIRFDNVLRRINDYYLEVIFTREDYVKKLPFSFLQSLTRHNSIGKTSITFNYDLIYHIYTLLNLGLKFSTAGTFKKITSDNIKFAFNTTRDSGFKIYEDFCFQNEKYRILSVYISLSSTDKMFKKDDEIINVDQAYQKFQYVPSQYGFMSYYLLENGWTFRVKDEEDQYRIIRERLLF